MTEDNAVEAVAKAIRKAGKTGSPLENAATAALAAARPIIEREAYEKAAQVADQFFTGGPEPFHDGYDTAAERIATAIRRLAEKDRNHD